MFELAASGSLQLHLGLAELYSWENGVVQEWWLQCDGDSDSGSRRC